MGLLHTLLLRFPNEAVEIISSYSHRAVNKIEYQVEIPVVAPIGIQAMFIAIPKAAIGDLRSSQNSDHRTAEAGDEQHPTHSSRSRFL